MLVIDLPGAHTGIENILYVGLADIEVNFYLVDPSSPYQSAPQSQIQADANANGKTALGLDGIAPFNAAGATTGLTS